MEKINEQLMMEQPMKIVADISELKPGTLMGFKAFKDQDRITAAYPVRRILGDEIHFVLFTKSNGQHVVDNTWLGNGLSDIWINTPPVIVDMEIKKISTLR